MVYIKTESRFKRKYGKNLTQLAQELKVTKGTISKWDRKGFDIFYKAKSLNGMRGNKYLQHLWINLQSRCGNPKDKKYKYYGGKGIKIKLDKNELITLWKRDCGEKLKQPSIDRIDSTKDYEFTNCRFIEMEENRSNNKENLSKVECKRCNHLWLPKKLDVRQCPSCHSCWWDTEKNTIKQRRH
jgi:hypothetical protein